MSATEKDRRYEWRNVVVGGGGGFVPGIVFNQRERDLVYARTDIGGAYRWDRARRRWTPLLDWVGWDQCGYTGVVSLATDALEPHRLYLAVGNESRVSAAWLRFPGFSMEPLAQVYRRTGPNTYHYESAGGKFVTELSVSEAGLVTSYGDFWQSDAILVYPPRK